MSEEERRRYALEQEKAAAARETDEADQELEFDEPRHEPGSSARANLEDKDGAAALLDEEEHARRVREQTAARDRGGKKPS